MAYVMKKPLPRRTFLKGSGVAVGLPWLEAMIPARASAQAAPKRFLVAWAGQIAYTEPHAVGPLPATLPEGWSSLQGVKGKISIVSRMGCPIYNKGLGQSPSPGAVFQAQHGNSYGPQLSGMHSIDGVAGGNIRGETIDQVIAREIGAGTRFPVVVNITQASNYNGQPNVESYSRVAIGGTLQSHSGHRTPTELYNKLFGAFSGPSAGGTIAGTTPAALLARKKSVLDVIDRGSAGVLAKLSPADRARVAEHFAQIRNLEKGLTAPPPNASATMACGKPTPPMAETPPSTHGFGGWANETYRGQIAADILALAFACDLTRSVMWMITRDQSWLGSQEITGVASDFHAIGHDITGGKVPVIVGKKNMAWVAGLWGRFVENISKIPEGSGTVLDNTFTTLMFSEGNNPHGQTTYNIPYAGMPSRFKVGEWIDAPAGTHPANYLIAVMQGMGINKNTHGEISGPFTPILR